MRVYKTLLNSNQDLISYVLPDEVEKIYSTKTGEMYDIPFEDLCEYIELCGYLTLLNLIPKEGISYVIFIDIDHKFKPWDVVNISHIVDQVHSGIRQNLIDAFFRDEGMSFSEKSDVEQENMIEITGESTIIKNETIYLHHNYKGGIWESSNNNVIEIDKYSGKIFGKNIGESNITYNVDTGSGFLTCSKKIEVVYEL